MSVIRDYDLPPFTAVEVSSGLEAEVGSGMAQHIRAEASDEAMLERLVLEVVGDTLHASLRHGFFNLAWPGGRLLLSVAAPEIDRLDVDSGSDVHFVGDAGRQLSLAASTGSKLSAEGLDVGELVATASGGSALTVAGQCGIATLETKSGSTLEAGDLDCAEGDLRSSSGSRLSAKARDAARIAASSGSTVELRGRPPRLDQHVDGGSSVHFG